MLAWGTKISKLYFLSGFILAFGRINWLCEQAHRGRANIKVG